MGKPLSNYSSLGVSAAIPSPAEDGSVLSIDRLNFATKETFQFIDITDEVAQLVKKERLWFGTVVLYSLHTTAALVINEAEPYLLDDFKRLLEELCPDSQRYGHDEHHRKRQAAGENERPNGSSHCRALLLPTSVTIPVVEGTIQVGRWQRAFLVELDIGRPREVLVQCLGLRSLS